MLDRHYWSDLFLALTLAILPIVLSLPFLYPEIWTYNQATLFLAAKTLGILDAPGYPLYLLLTHALSWLLPFNNSVSTWQIVHIVYLGCLTGLVYLLGRTLLFPQLVCITASLSLFFTPWIWPEILLPLPITLHLNFLILFFIMLFRFILTPPLRFPQLSYFFLGILGGISAGQESLLWIWILPALLIVTTLFRTNSAGFSRYLIWLALGLLIAVLVPYSYLLFRLFSLHAFNNPDLIPQLSSWRESPTLELIRQWLLFYFRKPKFLMPEFTNTVFILWDFLRSLPFLTLCCWIIGSGSMAYQLFFPRAHTPNFEKKIMARSLAGGLPFLVIITELCFFPNSAGAHALTWVLSGTLWGFTGYNYIYEKLGHPATRTIKPNPSPLPTPFAIIVLLCVPLLAWTQMYPSLCSLVPSKLVLADPAEKTRAFLNALPPKTLLIFSQHADSHFIAYLQQEKKVRTDVICLTWSETWPNKPYSIGRSVLELLSDTSESRTRRRLIFADYWNQSLLNELSAGRSVYLLTSSFPKEPVHAAFQKCFKLSLDCSLEKKDSYKKAHSLLVFRVQPQPPQPLPQTIPKLKIKEYK